jgi:hypothetical protein
MLSREFDGKSREQIIETPSVPTPVIWAATVRARAARDRDSNRREVEAAGEQYPWSTPQQRLVYADDSFESPCRAWE